MNYLQKALTRQTIQMLRTSQNWLEHPLTYHWMAQTWWRNARHMGTTHVFSKEEIIEMAYEKSVFVDITLTHEDKVHIKELADKGDWLADTLEEMVENGYRISLAPDKDKGVYKATVSPVTTKTNKGKVITSRSKNPIVAITATMYKVSVLTGWGEWSKDDMDEDDWME